MMDLALIHRQFVVVRPYLFKICQWIAEDELSIVAIVYVVQYPVELVACWAASVVANTVERHDIGDVPGGSLNVLVDIR